MFIWENEMKLTMLLRTLPEQPYIVLISYFLTLVGSLEGHERHLTTKQWIYFLMIFQNLTI